MGGGAAFFDYDHDGWLDIFLVNGTSLDPAVRDRPPRSYLFHNNRDGTFTDVTEKAGLTHSGWGQGCCVGDYDNDGFDDLFVTYWGKQRPLPQQRRRHVHGRLGESRRRRVAGRWGAGCCFLDYDRDGHLDLFVASYVNFDPAAAPRPGQSAYCRYNDIPVPCGPLGFAGGTNVPLPQPRRRHVRGRLGGVGHRPPARTVLHGLRRQQLAAHRAPTAWARRRPTSTTTAGPTSTWPATPRRACSTATTTTARSARSGFPPAARFDEDGAALAGMGVGVGDYDGDGWLDIVRTNFSEQVTTLYRNYGGGRSRTRASGPASA